MKTAEQQSEVSVPGDTKCGSSLEETGKKNFLSDSNTKEYLRVESDSCFSTEQYDEIDYIESLLSSDIKEEMKKQGVCLRPRRGASEQISPIQGAAEPIPVFGSLGRSVSTKSDKSGNSKIFFKNRSTEDGYGCDENLNEISVTREKFSEVIMPEEGPNSHTEVRETSVTTDRTPSNSSKGKDGAHPSCGRSEASDLKDARTRSFKCSSSEISGDGKRHNSSEFSSLFKGKVRFDETYVDDSTVTPTGAKDIALPKDSGGTTEETEVYQRTKSCGEWPDGVISNLKFRDLGMQNEVRCPIVKRRVDLLLNKVIGEKYVKHGSNAEQKAEKNSSTGNASESSSAAVGKRKKNEMPDEVEKRIGSMEAVREKLPPRDKRVRKFYFGKSAQTLSIEGELSSDNLRFSTLYGKIYIKEGCGRYRLHWVQLRGSALSYFGDRKYLISSFHTPNETAGDIVHPDRSEYFLMRKSMLSILGTRIYVANSQKSFMSFFKCSFLFREEFPELFDITEDRIISVNRQNGKYVVKLASSDLVSVRIHALEFALENSGNYVFFKAENPSIFMRWLTAISCRKGKQMESVSR